MLDWDVRAEGDVSRDAGHALSSLLAVDRCQVVRGDGRDVIMVIIIYWTGFDVVAVSLGGVVLRLDSASGSSLAGTLILGFVGRRGHHLGLDGFLFEDNGKE